MPKPSLLPPAMILALSMALAQTATTPARADEPPPVVTQHRMRAGGTTLTYTAEAGRIAIRDVQTGEPHAYMFYVAYRIPSPGKPRPVTFIWGGGPGGSSLIMDVGLVGPLRASGDLHDGDNLVESDRTWLTETDLVIVDQVGTGYSRPTRPEYAAEFNGTIGDTNSFAEFIRCWRIRHDAEDTPVFVGGGSWGAPRAATVGYALLKQGIPVHGTILMTGETSLNKPYISPLLFEALRVVGMAEVARFHKRLPPEFGDDRVAVAKAADAWVRQTYVPALERIATLSPAERSEIVAGLSHYTGVPAGAIDRETLVITPRQFHTGLFRDEDKVLVSTDVRRIQSQAPRKPWKLLPVALRRIKYDLRYRTDLSYLASGGPDQAVGFPPSGTRPAPAGEHWDFATSPVPPEQVKALLAAAEARGAGPPTIGTPLPATEEAVLLNPQLKVLVVLGRYDGESTCPSNAELERNLPPHLKRAMKFVCYDSGHVPWGSPGIGAQLANEARALIRSAR